METAPDWYSQCQLLFRGNKTKRKHRTVIGEIVQLKAATSKAKKNKVGTVVPDKYKKLLLDWNNTKAFPSVHAVACAHNTTTKKLVDLVSWLRRKKGIDFRVRTESVSVSDAELMKMAVAGMTVAAIAARTGYGASTVSVRLSRLRAVHGTKAVPYNSRRKRV